MADYKIRMTASAEFACVRQKNSGLSHCVLCVGISFLLWNLEKKWSLCRWLADLDVYYF